MAQFQKYNLWWPTTIDPASVELDMIKHGGQWEKQDGTIAGEGLVFHFKEFIRIVWPWVLQHKWFNLILENYVKYRTVVLIGPASSSKTFSSAILVLVDYFAHPDCTTVICCSTTKERLQDRVWADITKLFREAKSQRKWLPGNIIEGRLRIITDSRKDSPDGRDFRNGVVGVAAKRGESFVGLSDFAGIKNKRVRLLGDELCFPIGTLVDTPSGTRAIETLRPGDAVLSAVGNDRVAATSLHFSESLVRIKCRDGRKIVCTPNHPLLTQDGWEKACEIGEGSYLLSAYEAMQILRCENASHRQSKMVREVQASDKNMQGLRKEISIKEKILDDNSANLRAVLQCEVNAQPSPAGSAKKNEFFPEEVFEGASRICCGDGKSSSWISLERGGQIAALENHEVSWCEASGSRREWDRPDKIGESFDANVPMRHLEFWRQDGQMERQWISSSLQSGFRISKGETGNRGRWIHAQQPNTQSQRQEKGGLFNGSWVESVEVLKPDDSEFRKTSSAGYSICNLRVEDHPSFSVNGFLVHNSLLPRAFCDSISNLDKNPDFKCIGLGNPKETTDALGVLGEPAPYLGGWDGGIDQAFGTKTWAIRRDEGIAIQLPGDDSPNLDGQLGIPLISQADMNRDISFYGKESLWYTMMDLGRMPKGQGSRRVLTRQLCLKYNTMDEPVWRDNNLTHIAFLDAAYRGVGGDRCVFGTLTFGYEVPMEKFSLPDSAIAHSMTDKSANRQVIALKEMMVVPIDPSLDEPAEYQIAAFVRKQCEERGIPPEDFFYDAGMRTSLVGAFVKVWGAPGETIDFGGSPTDDPVSSDIPISCKDYYSKFVSQLWFSVRMVVEAGQQRGFTEDIIMEFSAREYGKVGGNKTEVEPKEKVKEKTGRSPDLADAYVCGLHGALQRGFHIASLKPPPKQNRTQNDWRTKLRDRARKLSQSGQLEYAAS